MTENAHEVVEGFEAYAGAAAQISADARRVMRILSFNLDRRLYGSAEFHDRVKDFLLLSQHSRLRILFNETRHAAEGHRLIELGRRLSSFVEFRVLPDTESERVCDWLIVDERHLLLRQRPEALEGRLHHDAPALCRQYRAEYDELWARAEPALAFRTIGVG